jgi:dolichyl-phosphate beta-glucosyltransferase
MHLSIVIPCYNEEKRIGKTLERIREYLLTQNYSYEVIVIDNGSKDATSAIVNEYKKTFPSLEIISRKSHGKGWAVKQGMLAAKGDFKLFTDADNSTDVAQVEKLLSYAERGYDVVISSRKIEGAVLTQPQPFYRIWLGNIFAFFVKVVVPIGDIKDTQNGFKLFTCQASEKIFTHLTSYYWAFDVEVLALAKLFGYKIKEVPIIWVNDERTKMNFKGMARMILEVILVRLHLLTYDASKIKTTT